jgi:hypothetical protein
MAIDMRINFNAADLNRLSGGCFNERDWENILDALSATTITMEELEAACRQATADRLSDTADRLGGVSADPDTTLMMAGDQVWGAGPDQETAEAEVIAAGGDPAGMECVTLREYCFGA